VKFIAEHHEKGGKFTVTPTVSISVTPQEIFSYAHMCGGGDGIAFQLNVIFNHSLIYKRVNVFENISDKRK
jgi:hypothetical protein